ncbi:MAG: DUF192 domain-containing protein [Acidobacteriota bacterium]|nr:DUF192 domain-containing protein [Acidobacteriota bacterium]
MLLLILIAAALLSGCGEKPSSIADLNTRTVILPNGARIEAEVKLTGPEMARGMMFRDSLPKDRGMLFVHNPPGQYAYWMYQCKFPLDIIWMDSKRRIVEIAADSPPCRSKPADCPSYGGHRYAQFVLELGGGEAQRHGLREGLALSF